MNGRYRPKAVIRYGYENRADSDFNREAMGGEIIITSRTCDV